MSANVNYSVKRDVVNDSDITRTTKIIPTIRTAQVSATPSGKIALDAVNSNLYYSANNVWNNVSTSSSPVIGASVYSNIIFPTPLLQYTVSGQIETIPFDSIDFDSGGIYSTITNLFTVPEDGLYQLSSSLCWFDSSVDKFQYVGAFIIVRASVDLYYIGKLSIKTDGSASAGTILGQSNSCTVLLQKFDQVRPITTVDVISGTVSSAALIGAIVPPGVRASVASVYKIK